MSSAMNAVADEEVVLSSTILGVEWCSLLTALGTRMELK